MRSQSLLNLDLNSASTDPAEEIIDDYEGTVCIIVREVTKAIVRNLWKQYFEAYFPSNINTVNGS